MDNLQPSTTQPRSLLRPRAPHSYKPQNMLLRDKAHFMPCHENRQMAETQWQLLPPECHQNRSFLDTLLAVHQEIYQKFLVDAPLVNSRIGFHLYAYRRTSRWRTVLILTPWMMSRLLFPEQDPHIRIPEGWSGEDRGDTEYQALGPTLRLGWSGNYMEAHLNYHTKLGHYLLQPITLDLRGYSTSSEVIQARNSLIRNLERNITLMPLAG
jgi:hypothetical protein